MKLKLNEFNFNNLFKSYIKSYVIYYIKRKKCLNKNQKL